MRILFWYILWAHLQILTLCLVGLTTIYLVVDFFERLRKFLGHDAELTDMLQYFFLKVPFILFHLSPLASLMATILTVGLLNNTNEILAMRSTGMSILHLTLPFLVVSVIGTIILFTFGSIVMPVAYAKAEHIKTVKIQHQPEPLDFVSDNVLLRLWDNAILHVRYVLLNGTKLSQVKIYQLDTQERLKELTLAPEATFTDGQWSLHNVIHKTFQPNGVIKLTRKATWPLVLDLTPDDLKRWNVLEAKHLTLNQLENRIEHLRLAGNDPSRFLTEYWRRVAYACVQVVMTLLGLSVGLLGTGGRGNHMAKGIGQTLGIGFVFWVVYSFSISLGNTGALWPVVAAWSPCLMLLLVTFHVFLKVRF